MKLLFLAALAFLFSGCSFHIGMDYQGKTGVRDVRYSGESADDEGFQKTVGRKY